MLIPLRTEVDSRRSPLVTPSLIAVNGALLLALLMGERMGTLDPQRALHALALSREGFRWWQPVTYQFVHDLGSIWHLLFNMLFLWVFGSAVEGRLGRAGFLLFYLAGGAVAGMAHLATSAAPVIGASGAVSACCGAFLALFPRAQVRVLTFFILIGVVQLPAALFIGLYILIDVFMQFGQWMGTNRESVAYAAHLAGYAFGFATCMLLLGTRVLKRTDFDAFYLFTQARRRRSGRQAAAAAAREAKVWNRDPAPSAVRDAAPGAPASARRAAALEPPAPPPDSTWAVGSVENRAQLAAFGAASDARTTASPEVQRRSRAIAAAFARLDVATAADEYLELVRLAPKWLLPEPQQLDVANQLLADGRDADSAAAYERLLAAYPRGERADEARLLLAAIWTRRLPDPAKARPLLESLRPRLRDAAHAALADQLLRELPA